MSVNVKQNGDLVRIANNYSIVQADWNEEDVNKSSHIKNQPTTLKTLDEIAASTDEGALAGASALKELMENSGGGTGSIIKVQLLSTKGNTISNVGITLNIKNEEYSSTTDNDGVAIFNGVTEVGTMTVTAAAEEFPSQTFKIEFFGSYELLMVDSDPYEDWLAAAGLNPASYEDIDELLEDEAAVRALMTKTAAVDILASYITGERLEKIINHRYAAKWINYREYAYSTLSANEIIKELMDESGMYGMYITMKEPKALIPTMTSNTTPSGEVFASSNASSFDAYKAFNGSNTNASDCWVSNSNDGTISESSPQYIGYKSNMPIIVRKMTVTNRNPKNDSAGNSALFPIKDVIVQGSNDGSKWDDLVSYTNTVVDASASWDIPVSSNKSYTHHRLLITSIHDTGYTHKMVVVGELQFYGYQEGDTLWEPKDLVPVMTSNTAPYGEASASSKYTDTFEPWKVFGGNPDKTGWVTGLDQVTNQWVQYKFCNPTVIKSLTIKNRGDQSSYVNPVNEFELVASNDGSNWNNLGKYTHGAIGVYEETTHQIENSDSYLYYRIKINSYIKTDTKNYIAIGEIKFYGRQLEALIPPMTSNTTPIGEASASSEYAATAKAWMVFDKDESGANGWIPSVGKKTDTLTYKFVNSTYINRLRLKIDYNGHNQEMSKFKLQGSKDGNNFDDLTDYISVSPTIYTSLTTIEHNIDVKPKDSYVYYRLIFNPTLVSADATGCVNWIRVFQLYGTPDYESRTYIYDHGVEVDSGLTVNSTSSGTAERLNDNILLTVTAAISAIANCPIVQSSSIDMSSYDVVGVCVDKVYYDNNGNNNTVSIGSGSTPTSLGYVRISTSGVLPKAYLDCSTATNTDANLYVYAGGDVSGNKFSISEWWLE